MKINLYKPMQVLLIILSMYIAITAFVGGAQLIYDPTGKTLSLHNYLEKMVFVKSYFHLGLLLILGNGLSQSVACFLLLTRKSYASFYCLLASVILLVWVSVQFILIGWFFYSSQYFILGAIELTLSIIFIKVAKKAIPNQNKEGRPVDTDFGESADSNNARSN